jgi:hypothetical protein
MPSVYSNRANELRIRQYPGDETEFKGHTEIETEL